MSRLRILSVACLVLTSSLSCVERLTWPFPDDAQEVAAPIPYRRWWEMTQTCAGRPGDFSAVRWFTVPDGSLIVRGQEYDGIWYRSGNRIVLTESSVIRGQTVRHEMLHAILQDGEHPPAAFVDRCGGVVSNDGDEEHLLPASLSPGPDAGSVILESRDLIGSVAVSADSIWLGLPDSGWVSVTVTVRNPRSVPVWVRVLPRHPSQDPGVQYAGATFGLALHDAYGWYYRDLDFSIDSLVPFAANESKRRVFDLQRPRVDGPGPWLLAGSFNEDTIATRTVVVVP